MHNLFCTGGIDKPDKGETQPLTVSELNGYHFQEFLPAMDINHFTTPLKGNRYPFVVAVRKIGLV